MNMTLDGYNQNVIQLNATPIVKQGQKAMVLDTITSIVNEKIAWLHYQKNNIIIL